MLRFRCILLAGIDSLLTAEGLAHLIPVTSICVEAHDMDEAAAFATKALGLPENHLFAYITPEV